MSDWMNTQLVRQYQQERLSEANQNWLVTQAKAAHLNKPIYAPTLAMIGGWLITWGSQLQTHYGNLADNLSADRSSDDNASATLTRLATK